MSDDTAPAPAAPSSAPAPAPSGASPAPTDGDNRYKALQHKLKSLGRALDLSVVELEDLQMRMARNASRAEGLAVDIANAQLDPTHVEMTNQVSIALGGAALDVARLVEAAHDVSSRATAARTTHSRLYGALDEVRSGRRERTPKPGFLVH